MRPDQHGAHAAEENGARYGGNFRFFHAVAQEDEGLDGIVIGCLYLPNGNPAPGPKFDYKLRWFERLHAYAAELFEQEVPVALVGDFNVMPIDVYAPERWRDDALFWPEVRAAYAELIAIDSKRARGSGLQPFPH